MRTKEQIMAYLVLSSKNANELDLDKIMKDAIKIENKYAEGISDEIIGYSLESNFNSGIAEDDNKKLVIIENINGLVVYSKSLDCLKDYDCTYGDFEDMYQQYMAEQEFDKEDLIDYFELKDEIEGLKSQLDKFFNMPSDKRFLYDNEYESIKQEIFDLEEDLEHHECTTWFENYGYEQAERDEI